MYYERPETLQDASRLLAETKGTAYILAGGTDLLVRAKSDHFEADLMVDIKSIAELRTVHHTAEGFAIGAAVSCADLGRHAALKAAWPGVVEAANLIGSAQIQSRCTIAGNLCNASPAADSVPAMVAAGARAIIAGPAGMRTVPVEAVPVAPGKTSLGQGEIVATIEIDNRPPRSGDAYLRFIPRTEMDIAVVGAGVSLTLDETGTIQSARVALGAVAPTVMLVAEAADAILGTRLEYAALERLAEACSAACRPINDKRGTVEFRKKVAGVLARRAARIAYDRSRGA
ncbi:xanthine dehydrogenase family protein subunit M [Tropicimonas sp. IMCC6043]|uniref:FAD binding domain-containing protein n=1 Tax=Tropicimonas sp. IMCC6043 TaxID=2510645 RepID=UPI00101DC966|nr:xanthine dehydrogenase family protein subunit M [Tropicimonas sp. IMCC6043]RYH05889.1 xanthine dehydrogenase family protein subunit M [Tropicimonas sp. IMCC6043]